MTRHSRNGEGTVLLINPSLYLEASYGQIRRLMRPVPYVNLAYLAAGLECSGAKVHVHDDSVHYLSGERLSALIREASPDLIGISCLTPQATRVAELSRKIRRIVPETPIVLGNIHAGYFAQELIETGVADAVVRGEADEAIVELLGTVLDRGSFSGIPGVSFPQNGGVGRTPERPLIKDLDRLPLPAWHLFPYREYSLTPLATIKRPLFPVLASRGCPYGCTFCVNRMFHRTYRSRSPRKVVEEITCLVETFEARQVSFFDSSFPLQKQHCLSFCREMIAEGLHRKVVWTSMTRPDLVDLETLQSMKHAGCRRIAYGMESGEDRLLRETGKGFRVEDIERAAALTRKAGIESCGYFMLGLPGDDVSTCQKTVQLALRLPLDFANFNLVVPYPGTDIYEKLKQEGSVPHSRWEKYATFNPDPGELSYLPAGLESGWLVHLQKQALFRFYFRPRMIFRHLFRVRTISLADLFQGVMLWLRFQVTGMRRTRNTQ